MTSMIMATEEKNGVPLIRPLGENKNAIMDSSLTNQAMPGPTICKEVVGHRALFYHEQNFYEQALCVFHR
jgi:hypothetical protein